MSSLRQILVALAAVIALVQPGLAGGSGVFDTEVGLGFRIEVAEAVPWRAFTLDAPPRLVVDLETETEAPAVPNRSAERAQAVRSGRFGAAWMRVVVDLNGPFAIRSATLDRATSVLEVMLEPVSPAVFRTLSGAPRAARGLAEGRQTLPKELGDGRMRVMLDPGHGGIDPGAEAGGLREADLALTFARELRGVLEAAGYHVAMTREDDRYVPLRTRVSLARGFRADVLVSLHADALPPNSGNASGATVYTLSEEASDRASERLAARHDRADLLAGADLSGQGDDIAGVLMDLARRETAPRAENLAEAIVAHLREATGHVNPRPHRRAAFAVLKAPDIPSVLVELGFLSSKADRARLEDPQWRLQAARALGAAISAWDGPEARAARLEFSE